MKSFLRPKCHALVLDPFLNSRNSIIQSISSIYLVAGMRGFSYLKGSGIAASKGCGPFFICRCLSEAVLYGAKLMKTRSPDVLSPRLVSYETSRGLACEENGLYTKPRVRYRVNVKDQFIQILYIGYKSLLRVYETKAGNLLDLLKFLRNKIQRLESQLDVEVVAGIDAVMSANVAELLNVAKW